MGTVEERAPRRLDWNAAFWAGIAGGILFALLELILPAPGFFTAPHLLAAIVLGEGALPVPGTAAEFDLLVLLIAMSIHVFLSIAYAAVLGWIIQGWRVVAAVAIGIVYGVAIYIVNFYLVVLLFPWRPTEPERAARARRRCTEDRGAVGG